MNNFNSHYPVIVPNAYSSHLTKEEVILSEQQLRIGVSSDEDYIGVQLGFPISKKLNPSDMLVIVTQCQHLNFYLKFNTMSGVLPIVVTGSVKNKLDIIVKIFQGTTMGKFRIEELVISLPNTEPFRLGEAINPDFIENLNNLVKTFPLVDITHYYLMNENVSNVSFVDHKGVEFEAIKNGPLYPLVQNTDSNGAMIDLSVKYVTSKSNPIPVTLGALLDSIDDSVYPTLSLNLIDGTSFVVNNLSKVGVKKALERLIEWNLLEENITVNFLTDRGSVINHHLNYNNLDQESLTDIQDKLNSLEVEDVFTQKNYFSPDKLQHNNRLPVDKLSKLLNIEKQQLNKLFNFFDSFEMLLGKVPNDILLHTSSVLSGHSVEETEYVGELRLLFNAYAEQLLILNDNKHEVIKSMLIWYNSKLEHLTYAEVMPILLHINKQNVSEPDLEIINYLMYHLLRDYTNAELNINKTILEVLEYARLNVFKVDSVFLSFLVLMYYFILDDKNETES